LFQDSYLSEESK